MHIAICDEKTPERKHLERLLERESDSHMDSNGNLLVDSFGSGSTFLTTASIYDLFFIDMTTAENASLNLAATLREAGIGSPIVFFTTTVPRGSCPNGLSNVFYLDKPVSAEDLSDIISTSMVIKQALKPIYDIRSREATYYISGEDFIYAMVTENRHYSVYLANGSSIHADGFLDGLAATLASLPTALMINKKYLLNTAYIKDVSLLSLTLFNGVKIPLRLGESKGLKQALAKLNQ